MKKILCVLLLILLFITICPKTYGQFRFPTQKPFPTFSCWWCFPTSKISPSPMPKITITPTVVPTVNNSPTPVAGDSARISLGAYVGDGFNTINNITAFENLAKKKLSIVLFYQAAGVSDNTKYFQPAWMNNISNHGSIPMVTWEFWNYTGGVNQPTYSLRTIINGNHDAYIRKWAQDSKAWGKPYYLRPNHEMNGDWYPWSERTNGNKPGEYVQAWKHMKDIFTSEGVTNVMWVWCPNVNYSGSTPLINLYPGESYVDWTCMDGYNWGYDNGGWQSFTQIFGSTYQQLTALSSKPIMIGETASAEQGGNKGLWIANAYGSAIDSMPRIKAINWFNANKERDWRINSTQSSLNAFTQAVTNSKY